MSISLYSKERKHDMFNFKDKLIELRKSRGMTQDELAKALKVARSTIGNYEKGLREPDFEMLEKLADYFNISMAELLDDDQASRLLKYYSQLEPLINLASQLDSEDLVRLEERAAVMLESPKYQED